MLSKVGDEIRPDVIEALRQIEKDNGAAASDGSFVDAGKDTLILYIETKTGLTIVGAAIVQTMPVVDFLISKKNHKELAIVADYMQSRVEGILQAQGFYEYAVTIPEGKQPWMRAVTERFTGRDEEEPPTYRVFRRAL
jgi:hypothetical protein